MTYFCSWWDTVVFKRKTDDLEINERTSESKIFSSFIFPNPKKFTLKRYKLTKINKILACILQLWRWNMINILHAKTTAGHENFLLRCLWNSCYNTSYFCSYSSAAWLQLTLLCKINKNKTRFCLITSTSSDTYTKKQILSLNTLYMKIST